MGASTTKNQTDLKYTPGSLIDLGTQSTLEFLIRFFGTGEVGVADEETIAVVVGVDKSAGEVFGRCIPNLSSGGVIDINTLDFNPN